MARQRAKAAIRKTTARALATYLERQRAEAEPNVIAEGVRAVAVDLAEVVTPGALYWAAPFRYVVEQMAPRVCRTMGLPEDRVVDVGEYLLAAFNEFVVSLVERFDVKHFEAWTAAQALREGVRETA